MYYFPPHAARMFITLLIVSVGECPILINVFFPASLLLAMLSKKGRHLHEKIL